MFRLEFIGDRKILEKIKKRHRSTAKKRGLLVSFEPVEEKEAKQLKAPKKEEKDTKTEDKPAEEKLDLSDVSFESVETSENDEDKQGDLSQLKDEPQAETPKKGRKRGRKPKTN